MHRMRPRISTTCLTVTDFKIGYGGCFEEGCWDDCSRKNDILDMIHLDILPGNWWVGRQK